MNNHEITIWVDADACPNMIKEVLFKAALRSQKKIILVANSILNYPNSVLIKSIQVPKGFDSADSYIVDNMQAGDLVITADIPLAADVIEKKGHALNPRGEMYSANNIKQVLNFRNMNEQMRSSGVRMGGPAALGVKEKTAFANALDKWLAKH